MRARMVAVIALLTLLAACSGGGSTRGDGSQGQPGDIALASTLVAFDACDELLGYVTEHALDMLGWGLDARGVVEVEEPESDDEHLATAPVEGVDYSGTNVQEADVDEPDTVKTDGERLYLLRDDRLHVVDVTGDDPALLASVDPGVWGAQLLRHGDRLLVLGSSEDLDARYERLHQERGAHPLGRTDAPWRSGTTLQLFDIADPATPELVASLHLDGWVVSARLVDGVARVVLRAEPVGLDFTHPQGSGIRAERDATERNREVIRASTVDNWVPYYVHEAGGRESEGTLLACERVSHPREFAGLGTTSVLSIDLDGDLAPHGTAGVLAGGETVYASPERLYVATNRWTDWEALTDRAAAEASERFTTELHGFDITDPQEARYIGSGTVRGHVLNQWALSAHDGVLRVATTQGSPWWGWREDAVSESFVTTFAERDGELVELGQVGGLGLDERIYAVRYMGDLGFVVTFRETDPLYTLDLSDPTDPRVLGELKIMGYSAYLHPVGEGLILGVGQDADERGMTKGLQLSLFDVSDLADPQRIHQVTLPDTYSGAEWDHRAFLHWPVTGLTVIPFAILPWDDAVIEEVDSGALGYRLDRDSGFVEVGRVTHLPDDAPWDIAWRATIERSIVVGDKLYTVSDLGVKSSNLASFDDVAWLGLPPS